MPSLTPTARLQAINHPSSLCMRWWGDAVPGHCAASWWDSLGGAAPHHCWSTGGPKSPTHGVDQWAVSRQGRAGQGTHGWVHSRRRGRGPLHRPAAAWPSSCMPPPVIWLMTILRARVLSVDPLDLAPLCIGPVTLLLLLLRRRARPNQPKPSPAYLLPLTACYAIT